MRHTSKVSWHFNNWCELNISVLRDFENRCRNLRLVPSRAALNRCVSKSSMPDCGVRIHRIRREFVALSRPASKQKAQRKRREPQMIQRRRRIWLISPRHATDNLSVFCNASVRFLLSRDSFHFEGSIPCERTMRLIFLGFIRPISILQM